MAKLRTRRDVRYRVTVSSVAAMLLVVAGCSNQPGGTATGGPEPEPRDPRAVSTQVRADGVNVTVETDSGSLTVIADSDVAAAGTELIVTPSAATSTGGESALQAEDGAKITLGSDLQPQSPISLAFAIPESNKTFDALGDDVDAVIVAVSEGDEASTELLPATWDSRTRTLSAQTTHLTSFFPGTLDYSGLRTTVRDNVDGFVGRKVDAPSCYGKPVKIGEVTYETAAPEEDTVWPCVGERGGNLVVTLHSNSPLGWIVRSEPAASDRKELTDLSAGAAVNSVAYGSLLSSAVGDGVLLFPLGSSELTFTPPNVPRTLDLRVEAAMTLVDIGVHGTSMVWGGNALADATNPGTVEDAANCLGNPITFEQIGSASDTEAGALSRKALDCATTGTDLGIKSSFLGISEAGRKVMGNVIGGIASLPKSASLLATTVQGLGGEFTGKNSATVVIRASGGDSVNLDGVPDSVFSIDRFEMSNRLTEPVKFGKKIGPSRYQMSGEDNPGVDMTYSWIAYTADDRRYTGEHCQIVVTVHGPDPTLRNDLKSAKCTEGGKSSFGGGGTERLVLRTPGEYTVRMHDLVTGKGAETTFIIER